MSAQGTETFEHGGEKYTAVFGFRAMEAVEDHYDKPFFHAIQSAMPSIRPEDAADADKLRQASLSVRIKDMGVLFQSALLQHHRDLTKDQVADIIDGIGLPKVGEIVGKTIASAIIEEADDGSEANPPKSPRKGKTG